MQSAASNTYAEWLEAHGAAWCHRMSATMTAEHCLANMYKTDRKSSDSRCAGCGGLDNQPGPGRSFLPAVVAEEPDVSSARAITAGEEDEDLSAYTDDELDDEALLALFPMLHDGEDERKLEERFVEPPEPSRYAVYLGRCRKCGGYMANCRERHDSFVYRCFACGWRTSPEYERNRQIQAAGMDGLSEF